MAKSWWLCEGCRQVVEPTAVTFEDRHDPRAGGCGAEVIECSSYRVPTFTSPEAVKLIPIERINGTIESLQALGATLASLRQQCAQQLAADLHTREATASAGIAGADTTGGTSDE